MPTISIGDTVVGNIADTCIVVDVTRLGEVLAHRREVWASSSDFDRILQSCRSPCPESRVGS